MLRKNVQFDAKKRRDCFREFSIMTLKQNEEVVLCRLVRLFRQSPLMYLSDSNVWTYRGDESLKLTLVDVVSDHQNFVDRAETGPLKVAPLWQGCMMVDIKRDLRHHSMKSRWASFSKLTF